MTDDAVRAHIAAERADLVAVLAALPEHLWDTPTLCAGWRVREVVAHTTMPFRYSPPTFILEMLRSRGNFAAMADRLARRDAASMSTGQLVGCLRDNVHHPWKPPGGGLRGALTHEVVHGLDYTVPLGVDRQLPQDRLRLVLDNVLGPESVRHFGIDLQGISLHADDLDWRHGSGTPVYGSGQDLVLVLTGRRVPAGRLRGAGAERFIDARRPA